MSPTTGLDDETPRFCCFGCRIAYEVALPAASADGDVPRVNTLLLRLGLGIFLAMNIMVANWVFYSEEFFGLAAQVPEALAGVFSYLALFLATAVMTLVGMPLLSEALRQLRRGRPGTQLLIVIGVFSAYFLSVYHTLRGSGSLYYDTAAMVLVIVTLGSYLEAGARQRAATSASEFLDLLPSRIRLDRDGTAVEVNPDEVRIGDVVLVRPGEAVPVDGRVIEGEARLDEASLTGEALPREVGPGDPLMAGTVSLDGQLRVRADQIGDDTVLALVERSLAAARAEQPAVQRLADRVAAAFVPAVISIALAVFFFRTSQGQAATGLLDGLAVLLISCPCALGLAAPLASWQALRRAAEHGVLVDSAATLERAAGVDHVFFDKTGTLTRSDPGLADLITAPGVEPEQALEWAASLEMASTHPVARAVLEEARRRGIEPRLPEMASTVAGLGIEGRLDGRTLRLGSGRWVARQGLGGLGGTRMESAVIYLMDRWQVLARFALAEKPRPEAPQTLDQLGRMGIEVSVLSGDRDTATRDLASRLGVEAEGGLLPDDKVSRLKEARAFSTSSPIAMVGDGINDAPVLAAADVGIAVGSASDLAQRSGNVRLLSDRLDRVPLIFAIARDARRRIAMNLAFAFGFNTAGVALAVVGQLTPIFAAVAMVASSLLVVRISSAAGARAVDAIRPASEGESR